MMEMFLFVRHCSANMMNTQSVQTLKSISIQSPEGMEKFSSATVGGDSLLAIKGNKSKKKSFSFSARKTLEKAFLRIF